LERNKFHLERDGAEWLYLHSDPWTPELTARFQEYIEMVKNRICAMAEAAKLSADTP